MLAKSYTFDKFFIWENKIVVQNEIDYNKKRFNSSTKLISLSGGYADAKRVKT